MKKGLEIQIKRVNCQEIVINTASYPEKNLNRDENIPCNTFEISQPSFYRSLVFRDIEANQLNCFNITLNFNVNIFLIIFLELLNAQVFALFLPYVIM